MKYLTILILMLSFNIFAKTEALKLTPDNSVSLRDSFNSDSIAELKRELIKLDANLKSGYPIYLVLRTPGGSIQAGLELFEFIKGMNRPVHTVTNFAASMGFQTVQNLGKRYILNYGVLMSHKARGGFKGEFGGGLSQLDSRYNMWLKRIDMLDKQTVSRTDGKQTLKSYRAAYDNELWLNGPEAVAQGYADAIATVSCSPGLHEKVVTNRIDLIFFTVVVKFSGCPLINTPLSISVELLTNKGRMSLEDFLVKNGKFGKKCNEKAKPATQDYYGNKVAGKEAELCAYNKEITAETLKKALKEKEDFYNRNLKNSIEYSY